MLGPHWARSVSIDLFRVSLVPLRQAGLAPAPRRHDSVNNNKTASTKIVVAHPTWQ